MDANADLQQPLLENYRIIILPEEITYDAYQKVSFALLYGRSLYPNKRLKLWCQGLGGEVSSAFALVDLIYADGNIDGILLGYACSAHSYLWAACSRRYVYPRAFLGIHQSFNSNPTTDAPGHIMSARSLSCTNKTMAEIYARASDRSKKWWLKKIDDARSVDMLYISSKKLVNMGMAQWIKKS